MKPISFIAVVSVLACGRVQAGDLHLSQARIVNTVEHVNAHSVDPELPNIALASWLRATLGADTSIEWGMSDCDLQPDFSKPAATYPTCVGVRAKAANHISLKLHFLIGTFGARDPKHPTFEKQSFMVRGNILNGCIADLHQLSNLPRELKRLASMRGCDK